MEEAPVGTPRPNLPDNNVVVVTKKPTFEWVTTTHSKIMFVWKINVWRFPLGNMLLNCWFWRAEIATIIFEHFLS